MMLLCKFKNCTKALSEFEIFASGYCRKHQIELNKAMYKVKLYKYNGSVDLWQEIRTIPIAEEIYNIYSTTEGIANKEFYKYEFYKEDKLTKTIYSYSPTNFD